METPSQPKPKYVMTPEHRAKVIANLGKARLAPREKVYRKTDKRYAANLKNLEIGRAKLRREAQEEEAALRSKMESAFPPDPAFSGPSEPRVPTSGQQQQTVPGAANAAATAASTPSSRGDHEQKGGRDGRAPGTEELDQVTRLVGKRLRQVKHARRREGRRIMRVLTAALNLSRPLNLEQVASLATALLRCLDPRRLTEEMRRLNNRIARLLLTMIEARYGPEPLSELDQRGLRLLQQLREEEKEIRRRSGKEPALAEEPGLGTPGAGLAEEPGRATRDSGLANESSAACSPSSVAEPAPVEATATGQGDASSATDHGPETTDASSANPESPTPNPGSPASPESRVTSPATPPLPDTEPEFRQVLARALDLEPHDAARLSASIWERLQAWEPRHQQESDEVERFLQNAAANAPASDLRGYGGDLAFILQSILEVELKFRLDLDSATEDVHAMLGLWQSNAARAATPSPPGTPPAKPPAKTQLGDESEEPASGAGGAVA